MSNTANTAALNILNNIRVASPCSADWDQMSGDEQARFCSHCEKHVYNLSEMTVEDAVDLIKEKEGKLCVRLYRRQDGTMITGDCPVGVSLMINRMRKILIAGTTAILFATANFLVIVCSPKTAGAAMCETNRQFKQASQNITGWSQDVLNEFLYTIGLLRRDCINGNMVVPTHIGKPVLAPVVAPKPKRPLVAQKPILNTQEAEPIAD